MEQEGNQAHVKIQAGLDGQTLDRETNDHYSIQVLAIDKGKCYLITFSIITFLLFSCA